MKKLYIIMACLSLFAYVTAQNTGIGTPTPAEKLEVNGAIKIGSTSSTNAGTIRYQSGIFEGYNGSSWKAFTQLPSGTLVASATNPNASLTSAGFSFFAPVYVNKSTTVTTTADTWLGLQQFNAAEARSSHTAVWTGTKMLVWGGYGGAYLNTGGIYDPLTDTWTAMSASPLAGRYLHTAVWTGTNMIIWGGFNNTTGFLNDGAAYNPSTDTWTLLNTVNAPSARYSHTAVWTGTEMVIWGGYISGGRTNTGSKYNFSTSTWTTLPTILAPSARAFHTAIWTGSLMVVWGGEDAASVRKNDGAIYNNASNIWSGPTSTIGVPAARYSHSAVWTGTEMVVWGGEDPGIGFYNTGGKFNPSTNVWTSATTTSIAPALRSGHTAIWTGTEMIVYGGVGPGSSSFTYYNNGGRYNPSLNSWAGMGLGNAPAGRSSHTAVWTGSQMVIFGGYDSNGSSFNSGGRYIINSELNISIITPTAFYLFSKD